MLTSLRILVGAFMSSVPLIGLALAFVLLPGDDARVGLEDPGPPYLVLLGLVGMAVVVHGLSETLTYRVRPATGLDPLAVLQAGTVLRTVLSESVLFIGVSLAFIVASDGFLVFAVAGLLALVLLAVDAFPRDRQVRRTEAALRRAGAPSDLRQRLGVR